MLIPLRCDAPLYHGPWGTIGLIVLCFALHVTVGSSAAIDAWILVYGSWNPLEWLSSVVVHQGWLHLLGNMVFFWVFGLIVEGKVGWWRFLSIVIAIALLAGAVEQTIMLGADGGSLGLSGVIFGLIAIAWIWAPENEVDVLLLLLPFIRHFDVRVRTLGLIYICLEFLDAMFNGFEMSTPVLHLLGALAGVPIGILMLRKGWVDCEGWDWFSRRADGNAKRAIPAPRAKVAPTVAAPQRAAAALVEVEALLKTGRTTEAFAAWKDQATTTPAPVAFRLAATLVDAQQWEEAELVAGALLRGQNPSTSVRLLYAWVLLQRGRPAAALEQLGEVQPANPSEAGKLAHIRQEAERRKAETPYEFA